MSKIAKNIKVLRELKKLTQDQLAESLEINRSRIGAYEESRSEPPYELLIRIADYFQISTDCLLKSDLSKTNPESLIKIGQNRTLFPIMVDKNGDDLIEVVAVKASAGYLNGYSDPQFIEELPVMNLPFKIIGKHRAFGIKGDSMPPLKDGSIAVGKYLESLKEIKDGQSYIVLTKNEGVVYKRLYGNKENPCFEFHSDNPVYKPYVINNEEILEVWSFVCSLNIGEFNAQDLNIDNMIRFLQSYRVEMGK
ncbi:MAG: LexA family transcriptional regulator [Bacteroidetes bacterium]|nr:LexA family transcriptional regulator [Bacteroidota bacterium]HET6244531.1 XRE family transcriptional regulator [Bacteroidia bacterium]